MANAKEKPSNDQIKNALEALSAGATAEPAQESKALPERTPLPPVAAASKAPELVKRTYTLQESRLKLQGYLHTHWDVTAERGTTLEDIKRPDYWKHTASQLRTHDELTVIAEDGSWRAELFVVNVDRVWAKVAVLQYHDLTKASEDMPQAQEEDYEITWTSLNKFSIIKKSNVGMPALKDGFQTKLEAYQWLDGHLKTINS